MHGLWWIFEFWGAYAYCLPKPVMLGLLALIWCITFAQCVGVTCSVLLPMPVNYCRVRYCMTQLCPVILASLHKYTNSAKSLEWNGMYRTRSLGLGLGRETPPAILFGEIQLKIRHLLFDGNIYLEKAPIIGGEIQCNKLSMENSVLNLGNPVNVNWCFVILEDAIRD